MCHGRQRACVAVPHVHFVQPFVQDDCAGNVGEQDAAIKTQKLSSESSQRLSCRTKFTTNSVHKFTTAYHMQRQKREEQSNVSSANAVVDPGAVVIKASTTVPTCAAVL